MIYDLYETSVDNKKSLKELLLHTFATLRLDENGVINKKLLKESLINISRIIKKLLKELIIFVIDSNLLIRIREAYKRDNIV